MLYKVCKRPATVRDYSHYDQVILDQLVILLLMVPTQVLSSVGQGPPTSHTAAHALPQVIQRLSITCQTLGDCQYTIVQYGAVKYSTVQHCTVLYSTVQH